MRRRWSRISRTYLAASVVLAVAAGLLVRGYASRAGAAGAGAGPPADVVVAAAPLPRGSVLAASQLTIESIPRAFVPPGAIGRIAQAAGRTALTDLAAGEVVTQTRLARVRAGPVSSLIPSGLRAFAVPTSLPAAAIRAGDRVDVLATFGDSAAGSPHTETIVEGVEVLFVLGGTSGGEDSPLSLDAAGSGIGDQVTLLILVAPDQQSRLAFARAFANLEVTVDSSAG